MYEAAASPEQQQQQQQQQQSQHRCADLVAMLHCKYSNVSGFSKQVFGLACLGGETSASLLLCSLLAAGAGSLLLV